MAILRMMGVTETITETIDDYVSIAVRLARDLPWRSAVKAKISASKHRLYFDRACISGLEHPSGEDPKARILTSEFHDLRVSIVK